MTVPNDPRQLGEAIVQQVNLLHTSPEAAKSVTAALEEFQHHPRALETIRLLLSNPSGTPIQAEHYAAHTLATKIQLKAVPAGNAEFLKQLLEWVGLYSTGSSHGATGAVLRQLSQATADYLLLSNQQLKSNGQQTADLMEAITSLPPMGKLAILSQLPDELMSTKLFLHAVDRGAVTDDMVTKYCSKVLSLVDEMSSNTKDASVTGECIVVFRKWIKLARFSSKARNRRSMGDRAANELVLPAILNLSIFRNVLVAFHSSSTPVSVMEQCAFVLSECLSVTTDTTDKDSGSFEMVLAIAEAIVMLGRQLSEAIPAGTDSFISETTKYDWELIQRSKLMCRLLSEFGLTHFFPLVVLASPSVEHPEKERIKAVVTAILQLALHFVRVRHVELAGTALEFWYSALSGFLGASSLEDEEDDLFFDASTQGTAEGSSRSLMALLGAREQRIAERVLQHQNQEMTLPFLEPWFKELVPALLIAICCPADIEKADQDEGFEIEPFVDFRESCAQVISDSCSIVDPEWIIEQIGETLSQCCQTDQASGLVRAPWQRVEACIYVLTAVAPKAVAGQDEVIPGLLRLLPKLDYPREGLPALLLRTGAGRIVLYTSCYLAEQKELCVTLLNFFCETIIPVLPTVSTSGGASRDILKLSQKVCTDAVKTVLMASRMMLVQSVATKDRQQWEHLVQGLASVCLLQTLDIDARISIVTGIGSVFAVLPDWEQITASLKDFCRLTAEPLSKSLQDYRPPHNNMVSGPPAVKLFIASLSCCGHIRNDYSADDEPSTHPLLANLEEYWSTVQQVVMSVVIYHQDLSQQLCVAFGHIFAYTRDVAPQSAVFIPTLQLVSEAFRAAPLSCWMQLVRTFVALFGELTRVHTELVNTLCDLSATFVAHSSSLQQSNMSLTALTTDESKMVAETYLVLGEVLRFVDLVHVVLPAGWLLPTTKLAIACLEAAPIDAQTQPAIAAMLHFLERLVTWTDPPPIIHAAEDTERVCQENCQLVRQILLSSFSNDASGGTVLDHMLLALVEIWADKCDGYPQVLPTTGGVLRTMLLSSFQDRTVESLNKVMVEPLNFLSPEQRQNVVSKLVGDRADVRVFGRIVQTMAKEFHAERKRAKYGSSSI